LLTSLSATAATPSKKEKASDQPAISDVCYYANTSELKVMLANGRTYVYADVPAELAEEFCIAEDKSGFFRREVEGKFTAADKPGATKKVPSKAAETKATAASKVKVPTAKGEPATPPAKTKSNPSTAKPAMKK
jgi:hypothetical protein